MKYPPNTDTKYILKRAIALKQNKVSGVLLKIFDVKVQNLPGIWQQRFEKIFFPCGTPHNETFLTKQHSVPKRSYKSSAALNLTFWKRDFSKRLNVIKRDYPNCPNCNMVSYYLIFYLINLLYVTFHRKRSTFQKRLTSKFRYKTYLNFDVKRFEKYSFSYVTSHTLRF